MKEPLRDYCKIGLVHFMLWKDAIKGEGDFLSVKTILDDPYFDAIEVGWINDDAVRASVAEQVRASGKALAFAGQPVLLTQQLDLNNLDGAVRAKAVAAILDVAPQAYELGAQGFGVVSGAAVPESDKPAAKELLVKSLKEIAGALEARGGMPLVMETFDQLSYGKNRLIGPNADAAEIAAAVRADFPSFGLMIDLSHLPLQGETPRQAFAAAGAYIVHAHVGNCVMNKPAHPMNGDFHPPLCDPDGENGVEEVAEYLRVLLESGYLNKETRPFLSFEVSVYKDWTQEALLEQSKEVLDQAWARV